MAEVGQKKARNKGSKAERRQGRSGAKKRRRAAQQSAAGGGRDAAQGSAQLEGSLAEIQQSLAQLRERSEELSRALEAAGSNANDQPAAAAVTDESAEDLEHALELRRANIVPVDQPLALICQAQRSGGTLLGRLFDGHPSCHAHPHELHIGDRRPHTWPTLPLDEEPEAWFAKLQEEKVRILFGKGRAQIPLKIAGGSDEKYPVILPPTLQRRIFLDEVERRGPITSERQILDAYMTSLFNAWLDNQNLRGAEKRWVVAFSPRRAWGEGLEKFFELYPDGRLISILRDPLSWYSSAQGRDPEADTEGLLELWKRSAREMLEASRSHGEQVRIVRFERLLLDTPAAMRELAEFLEIEFDEVLTTPTFNGYPVGANSSYEVGETGVVTDPVERYKEVLSDEQQEMIEGECQALYEEALELTAAGSAAPADAAA